MARLSAFFVLLGLLGTTVFPALAEYNQTEQHINADCDNGCFFGSFPGGSCTNDPACMCDQQKYRERYFCCMGKKCAPSVLPDSIQRQKLDCEARNMPFTFDAEAVCGITLTTSSYVPVSTATTTATGDSKSSANATTTTTTATGDTQSSATSASTSAASSTATSTGSQTGSGGSTPTPTANSAPVKRVILKAVVILATVSGMLF